MATRGCAVRKFAVGVVMAGAALAGCGNGDPKTAEEKLARGREMVQQMSQRFAQAQAFTTQSRETRERVKADGTKVAQTFTRTATVKRPNRLYSKTSGDVDNEVFYDGVGLTFVGHKDKIFAQALMPETLDATLDALAARYGVVMSVADLAYADPSKALLTPTTTGGWVEREDVDGKRCHHLAFVDEGVNWDLWLPVEGEPLPVRMRVVRTGRKGQPATDTHFTAWNLQPTVDAAAFDPKVPADYEGIALIQRASSIVPRPDQPAAAPAAGR